MQALLRNVIDQIPKISNNSSALTKYVWLNSVLPSINSGLNNSSKRSFGALCSAVTTLPNTIGFQSSLLKPTLPLVSQCCGMKVKGRLRRRCKDCYFVTRQERLYVMCPTHGRHKQMAMIEKPHNTWILTHATQSKSRPW